MVKLFKYLSIILLICAIVTGIRERSKRLRELRDNQMNLLRALPPDSTADAQKPLIGYYYVCDSLYDGITVYRDILKKKKFPSKLPCMSELNIKKIENGMGYSELLFGQYAKTGGWVEMDKVVYRDNMFPEQSNGVYLVKSIEINGIVIYKDKAKRRKYKVKVPAMTELRVSRVSNGMAYLKSYTTPNYDFIDGWVEFNKLESKER